MVASTCLVLRIVAGCSTSSPSSQAPSPDGAAGESFTACEIQGYVSELDGGGCPEGTCPVLAFDTNGGRLACCTSIASGPGLCVDAAGEPTDAADADVEDAASVPDTGPDVVDASPDAAETSPPTDAATDGGG